MAERRMFAKTIVDSDAFLDMPMTSQLLYFHLSMRADDEGFINNPKRIQRMIGASDDDMRVLITKAFIIPFESGVVVIKHWRINNYIQKDRFKETVYSEERQVLFVKKDGAYTLDEMQKIESQNTDEQALDTKCIQNGYSLDTQVRLGKGNKKENTPCGGTKEKATRFSPPTLEEVKKYCQERSNKVDTDKFWNFYESKGWMVGKTKMKDWKAAVRTWEQEDNKRVANTTQQKSDHKERVYSESELHSIVKARGTFTEEDL